MALELVSQSGDVQPFVAQRDQSVTKLQGIFVTLINRNKELREKLEISQARYEKAEKEYGEKRRRLECEIKELKKEIAPLRVKLETVISQINHQIERSLCKREREIADLRYSLASNLYQECSNLEYRLNRYYKGLFSDENFARGHVHMTTTYTQMKNTENRKHGTTSHWVIHYLGLLIQDIKRGRENIAKCVPHKI